MKPYSVVVMDWKPERWVVIDRQGMIVYRDTDELTARLVCKDLNK